MKKSTFAAALLALSPSLALAAPTIRLTKCSLEATTHLERRSMGHVKSSPSKTETLYETTTLGLIGDQLSPGRSFYLAKNIENRFTLVAEIYLKSLDTANLRLSIADPSDLFSYEGTNAPKLGNQQEIISFDMPLRYEGIRIGSSIDRTIRARGGERVVFENVSLVCQ
jgi:hypothetical protein